MLDIGLMRRELAEEVAYGLANGSMAACDAALKIYFFASNPDTRVSTLALASQVERLLKAEQQDGHPLPEEAVIFLEDYKVQRKKGKSIGLLSARGEVVSRKDPIMDLRDQAHAKGIPFSGDADFAGKPPLVH